MAAGSQAQADAVDTVLPAENGAANATVKLTILQLLLSMLRPSKLAVVATNLVTGAALFNIEDATLAAPVTRQLTLTQLIALVNARASQVYNYQPTGKVGTTAGWVVGAANNLGKIATIPAAQTNSTLVLQLPSYKVGQHIRSAFVNGSIQSGGNAGTILVDLRCLTAAAAGATDASLSVMAAALSVTANTVLSVANTVVPTIDHVVAAGESFYLLLTATTGAAVTEEVQNIGVTVDEV